MHDDDREQHAAKHEIAAVEEMPDRTAEARGAACAVVPTDNGVHCGCSHPRVEQRIEQVDDQHRHRHRDDGDRGHAEDEAVIAGIHRIDQKLTDPRIAEDVFCDDSTAEDGADRHGEPRQLRQGRVPHHVGEQDPCGD